MKRSWLTISMGVFLMVLAWTPGPAAHAAGPTGEENALESIEIRRAPLVISGDGKWRVHMSSDRVLHRVNLHDEKIAQSFQLPQEARELSTSQSGQRVAFTSNARCEVGLVDFGKSVRAVPKLSALTAGGDCEEISNYRPRPIALSADGRLLATASQVLEIESGKVVATLPAVSRTYLQRAVLRVQFLAQDTKLLLVTASLGDGYESPSSGPSEVQFSVWDLRTLNLERMLNVGGGELDVPQALFQAYGADTGLAYGVDTKSHTKARTREPPSPDLPLDLFQFSLAECKPSLVTRFQLEPWLWQSMVVDPLGRWVAGVRSLAGSDEERRTAGGVVEWLEVFDLSTRQMIAKRPFNQSIYGLVALRDGSAVLGLTGPTIDQFGSAHEKKGVVTGKLVRMNVPLERLAIAKAVPEAWQDACLVEDEVEGARNVQRQERKARLLWSVTAPEIENPCDYSRKPYSFVMPDQTLWVDDSGSIQQIDARTGKALKKLPAPYKAKTCHLPVPASGGFVSYEGDTLVWRGLEAGADAAGRKVIERRPGWTVGRVRWDLAAGALLVYWDAKPETMPKNDPQFEFNHLKIVYLNPVTLTKLSEVATTLADNEMGGEGEPPFYAACERATGPQVSGYDWRVSHFDSFRAYQCGPSAGQTRTVLWSHIDIRPDIQPKKAPEGVWAGMRRVWGEVDGVAVAQDGKRLLVYEIASRRELAHFESDSFDGDHLVAVHLLPQHSLVVVETYLYPELGHKKRRLSAYSYG